MTILSQHRDYDQWLKHFQQQGEMYIFGYGSLMWKPEVEHDGCYKATAFGVSRNYCIISTHYRGTAERPGRVLGLEQAHENDLCHGIAIKACGQKISEAFDRIWKREMVSDAYLPSLIPVTLEDKTNKHALTYIADPQHPQYAKLDTPQRLADIINRAQGSSGSNLDYFVDTLRHLKELGVEDKNMDEIAQCLTNR